LGRAGEAKSEYEAAMALSTNATELAFLQKAFNSLTGGAV
jgi:predicted RNA polymerase sigma factor